MGFPLTHAQDTFPRGSIRHCESTFALAAKFVAIARKRFIVASIRGAYNGPRDILRTAHAGPAPAVEHRNGARRARAPLVRRTPQRALPRRTPAGLECRPWRATSRWAS